MLAALNHPGIATVHGLEQSGNIHFLIKEVVPDETLRDRVLAGPASIDETLKIGGQISRNA